MIYEFQREIRLQSSLHKIKERINELQNAMHMRL